MPQKEVEEKYDFENAIIRLLENNIQGFRLYILRRFNFYIEFSLQATDVIHIEFTPFKNFDERFEFNTFEKTTLQHLGFILAGELLFIDFDLKENSIQSMKILLSRIFLKSFTGIDGKILN